MISFGSLNKVVLVGRLTRDPEVRTFTNGGKVAKFGFAVSNRKKNSQTGEWEDDPMFIDVEAFNRGEGGKDADHVEQRLHKGDLVLIEGKLILDRWDDKQTGEKRSKHKIVADQITFLDQRGGEGEGGSSRSSNFASARSNGRSSNGGGGYPQDDEGGGYGGGEPMGHSGNEDDIPF